MVEGVALTANLYEWALQRRRNWKEEGRQEAQQEAQRQVREAQLKVQQARQVLRGEILREQIDKVLAADTLTAEEKVHLIGILNAV